MVSKAAFDERPEPAEPSIADANESLR